MEQGKLILNCSRVDMNELIQDLVKNHHIVAQRKNVTLKLETPEESKQITLDVNLFQRAVDNLITNSLKFSPANSTVTIRVDYPSTDVSATNSSPRFRLRVLDEGPGVPPEYHDDIFDKYSIVNLKNKDVSQIGLGLTFTKMVLNAHNGRVFVEDNEPKGAIFSIEI
jgi:signal transduction histidine kinase